MNDFQTLMETYYQQHQHPINQWLHKIGIPMILFSVFMCLSWVNLDFGTVWKVSFAWLVWLAASIYYCRLGVLKLAAATSVLLVILLVIALLVAGPYPTHISGSVFLILFISGWAMLLVGHLIEKSKPAFTESLLQALIAPLFLVNELVSLTGYHLVDVIKHPSNPD